METIENCTKSKSVLNLLGPIANQVVELKGKHGIICNATIVMNLLKQCQSLKAACDSLVTQMVSYAQDNKDKALTTEVHSLSNQLEEVVEYLTNFTRDLHRGDVGIRDNEEVWSDLVEYSEKFVTILTQALLAWDQAQVRKISCSIANLQKQLFALQQVHYVQQLSEDFQSTVSSCGKLLNLVHQRCKDLYRLAQCETLQLLSRQLCHTLPLLASACAANITYPLSKQLKVGRGLILSRLEALLKDLEFHAGQGSEEYDLEDAGSFISCVDKTLDLLVKEEKFEDSTSQPIISISEQIKSLLEEVLRHGVAVAYCSTKADNSAIMYMCENVLKQLKNLVNIERLESYEEVDFIVAKEILADSVESLEQKVNTALIRQIVKTFSAPLAPLESVLKAIEPIENEVTYKALEDLIADFDVHVDSIFQVGGFAAVCTSDLSRVRLIRDSLLTLEWLESCLIPSIVSAHNEKHLHAQTHAYMLAKHWSIAVHQLHNTLDEIMDPSAFSLVTKQEVHEAWAQLKEQLYTQDIQWLNKKVEGVLALASRVLVLHQLDSYLTGRQEEDFTAAICEIKKSLASVAASPKDLSLHRSLIKRVQLLLTLLSHLANSLNEENMQFIEEFSRADPKQPSSNVAAKLTEMDKHHLVTSNIDDIPVDVATPFRAKPEGAVSKNLSSHSADRSDRPRKHLKSVKSASKLGEGRFKSANSNLTAQGHNSRSLQAVASDSTGLEFTSIDITKFLSRSTNTLHSSTRSSKRNFSLKVKEINLDIDGALQKTDLPPLPSHSENKRMQTEHHPKKKSSISMNGCTTHDDKSLLEVSQLIAEAQSPLKSQDSIGNELTGILEDLTSLTGDLSELVSPSEQRMKRKWEQFDQNTSLHGIKIQNVSFNPKFPEIQEGNASKVSFDEIPDTPANCQKNKTSAAATPGSYGSDPLVWEDFTTILETKTPAKSLPFDFSTNFNCLPSFTKMSFTTFGKSNYANTPAGRNQSLNKTADLSDTPFLIKSSSQASLQRSTETISQLHSNYSVSPSSADFGTPQRLKDIQHVQERLKALKEIMK